MERFVAITRLQDHGTAIVIDPDADEFARSRMCETLAVLTLRNELPRAEVARFLQACSSQMRPHRDCFVWVGWASAIAMLRLVELKGLVEQACKRGSIAPVDMGFEDFEEDLRYATEHPAVPSRRFDKEFALFGETIEELSGSAAFDPERKGEAEDVFADDWNSPIGLSGPVTNPLKGVGRNDPCPCGSGKKFKKCCLGKLAA